MTFESESIRIGTLPRLLPASLLAVAVSLPALAAETVSLQSGVLVDPERSVVILMEPDGPVSARDLHSGNPIWVSESAGAPLAVRSGRVLVLAEPSDPNRVGIVALDAGTGVIERAIHFDLPDGVTSTIDERPDRRFSASIVDVGGEAVLRWSFEGRPLQGARIESPETPSPGAGPSGRERGMGSVEIEGAVRVDLTAARAIPIETRLLPEPARFVPDLGEAERIVGVEGRQFRSADDRFVLASERIGDARTWDRYRWTIIDRETGARRGSLRRPTSTAPFFSDGTTLVHVAPAHARRLPSGEIVAAALRLEAFDLGSGALSWTANVRDTAYRGVLPP